MAESSHHKVRVLAYAGHVNASAVRLRGRIVRYGKALDAGEGLFTRLRAMLAIYNSRELAGVTVRIEGYGQSHDVDIDEEGYFKLEIAIDQPLPEATGWEHVTISVPGRDRAVDHQSPEHRPRERSAGGPGAPATSDPLRADTSPAPRSG
jgi:hypothetical protein